ncbi:MAG: hypothetical protein JNM84_27320 [Planctomycetes bacterium]|nr:hypothetical protein [Planctomycetota bacterium]
MQRSLQLLALPLLALLGACASSPEPISQPSPVGRWMPDKGAMLTSLSAKLGEGHPSFQHMSPELLEALVEHTDVSWDFAPDHTYTMDFALDLGLDQRRVRSSGSWAMHDGLLKIVERQSTSGTIDPAPIVAVFDGQAMHLEKDQMTLVLYRR